MAGVRASTSAEDELDRARAVADELVATVAPDGRWRSFTVGPEACDLTGRSDEVTYAEHRQWRAGGVDREGVTGRARAWFAGQGWTLAQSPRRSAEVAEVAAARDGLRARVGANPEQVWLTVNTPCRPPAQSRS